MRTLLGTSDLSFDSIRTAFKGLIRRATIAGPFHVIGFFLAIILTTDLRDAKFAWIAWVAIVSAATLRYFQYRFAGKLLDKPETIWIWRSIFATHTLTLGLAWGLTGALSLYYHGLTSSTMVVLALSSCVSAVAIPAFSFDLLIQLVFQVFMFIPSAIAALTIDDPNAFMFSIGYLFFLVFIWYAGGSLFRFNHDLLAASELVVKQKLEIEKANLMVSTMLENIDEAFLNLNPNGVCFNQVSEKSKIILGIDPTGLTLGQIFSDDEKVVRETDLWLSLLFKQPGLFETLSELSPKIMIRRLDAHSIRLEYHPIWNAGNELTSIVVTGTDVTRELTAKKQAAVAQDRAELILRISENRAGFQDLLNQTETVIENMHEVPGALTEIRHDLHTLKGGMGIFGAMDFAQTLHRCELALRGGSHSPENVINESRLLKDKFRNWRQANVQLFAQLGVFSDQLFELSKRKIAAVRSEFDSNPTHAQIADQLIQKLTSFDFGDMFEDFRHYVEKASARLDKKVSFIVQRPAVPVLVDARSREILRSFIHLFNNSLDHGIERPEVRIAHNKSDVGIIQVSYDRKTTDAKSWVRITIEDDGAGINIDAIRTKLAASNSQSESKSSVIANMNDLELAERIFDNEFSTREVVTAISGQGVGMSSVKSAILKRGGRIKIIATSPRGTCFEVLLPA